MEPIIDYESFTEPPPEPLLTSLLRLHLSVFDGQTQDEVMAELTYYSKRGAFLMDLALADGQVVGYKAGYELKSTTFYSWLGCVEPTYRGRGIAEALMRRQHDWCSHRGYSVVRTQTYNQWRSMLILNLKHGFDVVGTQQGRYGLLIVLEKRLKPGDDANRNR